LLTGLSTVAVSGSACGCGGRSLSRKFGHGDETDGFFRGLRRRTWHSFYVASALRVVVLPQFRTEPTSGGDGLDERVGALGGLALGRSCSCRAIARGDSAVPHRRLASPG